MAKLIEQFYDKLSDVYDTATWNFSWNPPKKVVEVVQRATISTLGNTLEIGCGTGQVIEELDKAGIPYTSYTGIDISDRMIQAIQAKFPQHSFFKLDIETEQLPDEIQIQKYQTVLAIGMFEFLEDPRKFLDIVKGLLSKDWQFIFS